MRPTNGPEVPTLLLVPAHDVVYAPAVKRGAMESMIEDVLRPLLQADGADIELVELKDQRLVVRVHGEAAFGPGAPHVRGALEAALRQAAGEDIELVVEKAVPKATRRSSADVERPD